MKIRPLHTSEIPFLEKVLYEALYVPFGMPPYPESIIFLPEIYKYVKEWGREYDVALVAVENDVLIGAVWGRVFHLPEVGYGFVNENTPEISIALFKEHRNKGFGALLMKALYEEYKNLNFSALSLSVDKENKALNLYIREGFKIISENGTAWTMIKTL